MESTKQLFRPPFSRFALLYLALISFLWFELDIVLYVKSLYFFLVTVGIGGVFIFFYLSSSARISDDGVMITNLFGSKSLRWPEIIHISICGYHNLRRAGIIGKFSSSVYKLILHSTNKNSVSITVQQERYSELVGLIFKKRPELLEAGSGYIVDFTSNIFTIMEKIFWELLFIGWGVYIISQFENQRVGAWILGVLLVSLFLFSMIVSWVKDPQNIMLEGSTLRVTYLSGEKINFAFNQIDSIALKKIRNNRGGIHHDVYINIKDENPIILGWSAPLIYKILKRWHEKASSR